MKDYTPAPIRDIIVKRRAEGMSIQEIARLVGRNPSTVCRILQRWQRDNTTAVKPKSGRPKKTTKTDDRALIRLSKANPKLTARQLKTSWAVGSSVSLATTKRILRRDGFMGRIAANKPRLTRIQRLRRLRFCRRTSQNSVADWGKIKFSDEAKFELYPRRKNFVRRPSGVSERYKPQYTNKSVKFGGGSIMVWGFIQRGGLRKICQVDGTLNGPKYTEILRHSLLPYR